MCDSSSMSTYLSIVGSCVAVIHEAIAWFNRKPGDQPKSVTQWIIAGISRIAFRWFGRGFLFHGDAEVRQMVRTNQLRRAESKSSSLARLKVNNVSF